MARKPFYSEQTNAEAHATTSEALATLRKFADPLAERRRAVLVDGVHLGKRQNELRKPGSSFYGQSFLEANSAAQLAVSLDLDIKGAVEIARLEPPMPDVRLSVGGVTVAYIEHTMVVDDGARKIEHDLDELNAQIKNCEDAGVRSVLAAGTLTIRINSMPVTYYDTHLPIQRLVAEVSQFARSITAPIAVKIDQELYPLLGEMEAWGGYKPRGDHPPEIVTILGGQFKLYQSRALQNVPARA
jgi:hypothetical protein